MKNDQRPQNRVRVRVRVGVGVGVGVRVGVGVGVRVRVRVRVGVGVGVSFRVRVRVRVRVVHFARLLYQQCFFVNQPNIADEQFFEVDSNLGHMLYFSLEWSPKHFRKWAIVVS